MSKLLRSLLPLLLFITLLSSSCSSKLFSNKKKAYQYSELKNMWVENKEYFLGDTIRLFFSENHPGELGSKTPDGSFFYLVYMPSLSTTPGVKPIMSYQHFKKTNMLELIPGVTKANPHDVRYNSNKPLFTKSGTYTIFLGENLSTDAIGPAESIHIRYTHEKRKNRA